ncbi:hypothetical protein J6590_037876 [Homalodisca vitripennis]|nr:hypothetical protein J6590_037876 [Homalodisca vitripennis]
MLEEDPITQDIKDEGQQEGSDWTDVVLMRNLYLSRTLSPSLSLSTKTFYRETRPAHLDLNGIFSHLKRSIPFQQLQKSKWTF